MTAKTYEPTSRQRERAFLVGVNIYNQEKLLSLEDSLTELSLLAQTAGLDIAGQAYQKLDRPNPQTLIGPGKVQEILILANEVRADIILFDEELSPRHLRELEHIFGEEIRIIDRTTLILDIFAQHAQTREGSLQVELAQYEYRLPRLTRAWTHLARQAGGGGGRSGSVGGVGLRGPGETQLEVDRRDIRRRIIYLKEKLEKVRTHRQQYRSRRRRSQMPVVALVGYTNAGKSTLLNKLSNADIYVADQLFATLDPTTRRVELPGGRAVLFTDTVGFIQKLPTSLIASFRATLEEIADADLLLHIIDISHNTAIAQAEAVHETLIEIEADNIPVISILNKIDLLIDPEGARNTLIAFPQSVAISALTGEGIQELLNTVEGILYSSNRTISVRLPYQKGGLISLFHDVGQIENIEHDESEVIIRGEIPDRFLSKFQPYLVNENV